MDPHDVVPWGRSLEEYRRMFDLAADLSGRVLGCGDGPASFNAEATALRHTIVSCDPIYTFSADQIRQRVEACYATVVELARQNAHRYVWDVFPDADALGQARLQAMRRFLADYDDGRARGRYIAASLPNLPFADRQFDLCLCSHLLFLYSGHLDLAFHLAAIREMLRVASEVRIFPLLDLNGVPSPYVDAVRSQFERDGWRVAVRTVPYEFQRGGNRMMVIGGKNRSDE